MGTKLHVLVDGNGLPRAVHLTAGQAHESTVFAELFDEVSVPRRSGQRRSRPARVAGDKAYSVQWIRDWLRRKGIGVTIPRKANERRGGRFDKPTYKQRNVVESCIGWLQECRAITSRYDKSVRNDLAMIKLDVIRRYLRIGFSETKSNRRSSRWSYVRPRWPQPEQWPRRLRRDRTGTSIRRPVGCPGVSISCSFS